MSSATTDPSSEPPAEPRALTPAPSEGASDERPALEATPARARARRVTALAFVAFAYLFVFPYFPEINNPNENVRFYTTAALVDDGTYHIDGPRERWGWVNDAAVYEGHYCSVKAPATSLLGVPAYYAYREFARLRGLPFDRTSALWAVRIFASVLPALLFLGFYHRWLERRGAPVVIRDAVFVSVALGSMFYAYALLFVTHTLNAVAAFGAFMLLSDARRARTIGWGEAALAGFLTTLVTATEYPGFPATLILCLYALFAVRPAKRLLAFGAGALVPTLAVLHFHAACYGSPFRPGHRFLENEAFREGMQSGFYGADAMHWDAAGAMLFDPAYGLLTTTPIFFLALIGLPLLVARRRDRVDALVALAMCFSTYALITLMNNWRGGWTVGARYLAMLVPFVGWFALEGGRALVARTRMPRLVGALALGATSVGLLLQGGPSAYYPHLPEAFTRPLPQLLRPLVRYDFAPYNAGRYLFGWVGTSSMIPLFALFALILAWIAWGERRLQDRLVVWLGSFLFASWMLGPFISADPAHEAGALDARRYVEDHWAPRGEDERSRLEARRVAGTASERELERLLALDLEEGRRAEAERALRALERLRQAAGDGS